MTHFENLRVLIVADSPLARTGLASLLANREDCTVVGQLPGDADLPTLLEAYAPDALVWDLGWTPASGLERMADLKDLRLPIVALLSEESHAADAWLGGAKGLLLQDTDADHLVSALNAVANGLLVLDSTLSATAFTAKDRPPLPPAEALTPRESQVLQFVAEGLPNKVIAQKLGISEHTVKFHVNAILSKLGVQSRTEAVVRATRLGLIVL